MNERRAAGDIDDVDAASVDSSSKFRDDKVATCGHPDKCSTSQTQAYTKNSENTKPVQEKLSFSDLCEFKSVYDNYFHCSSDEEDDNWMDDVPDLFAPSLPSSESSPGMATDHKKMKRCLNDILDYMDDCEEKTTGCDENVFDASNCINEKTYMDGKGSDCSKSQNNEFGVVRSFLTGEVIRAVPHKVKKGGFYRASACSAPYLHKLFSKQALTEQEICDRLFTAPPSFNYGTFYKFEAKPDTWAIFWEPLKLNELTTLMITSVICAALNSRRRLHWVIGIGSDRKVLGCSVTTEERDTLTQAFIYAVRSGIVPQLHPDLVGIRFISVEGQQLDENEMRLLVTITIDHRVTTLYQLTSGRIYYVSENRLKEVEGGIDEARRMMQLRKSKDYISLVDQDPCGYLRYTWNEDSCRTHPALFFLAKTISFLVPGIALGLITRYAISRTLR